MLTSSAVRAMAFNVHPLLSSAEECSNAMKEAAQRLPEYWTELGGEELKRNCEAWSRKMIELKNALASIETGMLNHATILEQQEEDKRKADAQAAAEVKQRAADQAKAKAAGKK